MVLKKVKEFVIKNVLLIVIAVCVLASDGQAVEYITNGGYDGFSFTSTTTASPETCEEVIGMGHGFTGDMDGDCYVNGVDLNQFAGQWLRCIDPTESGCETPWYGGGGGGASSQQASGDDEVVAWADGFESGDLTAWNPGPVNGGWHTVETSFGTLAPHDGTFLATTTYDEVGLTDTTCVMESRM